MKITVITLFPEMINSFIRESILSRAIEKKAVQIETVNLRDFGKGAHKTVDDKPFGGGAGMVLKVDCIKAAIASLSSQKEISQSSNSFEMTRGGIKQKVILTSPRGKVYNQSLAQKYSKLDHLILVCGHYEGVDERVSALVDEETSLGDFVMTGGEIGAGAIVDSVVRLLPGVLAEDSAEEESFFQVSISELVKAVDDKDLLLLKNKGVTTVTLLEYPHYTRPESFDGQTVPSVLLSGDHQAIRRWRLRQAWETTKKYRPDLLPV